MKNMNALIDDAIENAVEMRMKKDRYERLPEGYDNGSHVQITIAMDAPISRTSIDHFIRPHRAQYGIVKHSIRKTRNPSDRKRFMRCVRSLKMKDTTLY
jgi:hypothetical protein